MPHSIQFFANYQPVTSDDIHIHRDLAMEIGIGPKGISTQNLTFYFGHLPPQITSITFTAEWINAVAVNDFRTLLHALNPKTQEFECLFDTELNFTGIKIVISCNEYINNTTVDLGQQELSSIHFETLCKFLLAMPSCYNEIKMDGNNLNRLENEALRNLKKESTEEELDPQVLRNLREVAARDLLEWVPKHIKFIDLSQNNLEEFGIPFFIKVMTMHISRLMSNIEVMDLAVSAIDPTIDIPAQHLPEIIEHLRSSKNYLSMLIAGLFLEGRILLKDDYSPAGREMRLHSAIDCYLTAARSRDVFFRQWCDLLLWGLKSEATIPSVEERLQTINVAKPDFRIVSLNMRFNKIPLPFFTPIPKYLAIKPADEQLNEGLQIS